MNVETSYKRPRIRIHRRTALRRLLRSWPVAVWAGLAVLALVLYARSNGFAGMRGVVRTTAEPVAALETARLVALYVVPGQTVTNGELIAELDTALLDAELALERARLAEAQETMARYRQNLVRMLHDAQAEARDAETQLALQELNARRDGSRLAVLRVAAERRKDLLERNLMDAQDAQALAPEIAALTEAVKAYPVVLDVCRRRQTEAEADMVSIREWLGLSSNGTPGEANRILTARANAEREVMRHSSAVLALRRERYSLRATRPGVVSRVYFAPGDVASAGAPIVRIVTAEPRYVIGLLPEAHIAGLRPGQKVRVFRSGRGGRPIAGIVRSVGPEVRDLPTRASPIRGQPLRGRRVQIELPEHSGFLSGETVEIRPLEASWRQFVQGVKRAI